jgi:energy-coupling factor transporter ATP-binding protein EcfA2
MRQLPFPERVLHQHIATLGKTGSGKSSAMRVIAEHLLDKQRRIVIVDPKGDWWGLKSAASGKSAGYPVIMFGDFKEPRATDVPINDRSGKHVAELIATGNRPCVLGFRGWMPAQLVRFWLDFAPALFNANEGELYLIIDEVHNFAPKGKIMDPDSGKCLHWTNRIMSEGRGLGMTFFIASQRPQKVHNDTLENCETLIAMRVTHPRSREATEEWINAKGDRELGKEVVSTLAELKTGEAWVWSPDNEFGPKRVKFPMFSTFDSFAPPQLQKKVSQAGWSEIDLDQVKEKLSAVIAEAKANDPKELKAEVARLRQELAKKPVPTAALTATDRKIAAQAAKASTSALMEQQKLIEQMRAEVEAAMKVIARVTAFGFEQTKINPKQLEQAIEKAVEEIGRSIAAASDIRRKEFDQLKREAESLLKRLERVIDKKLDISVDVIRAQPPFVLGAPKPAAPPAREERKPRPAVAEASAVAASSNGSLDKGEKAILLAAAQCHPADRVQLSILTGYKKSTRNRYIQFLQAKGYVEDKDEKILPTSEGMTALGEDYTPLPTGVELQRHWLLRLPAGEKHILAFVLQHGGEKVNREAIGEATGYMKSTRNRYIQFLQARHLLKDGVGPVEPAEMLFDGAQRRYG